MSRIKPGLVAGDLVCQQLKELQAVSSPTGQQPFRSTPPRGGGGAMQDREPVSIGLISLTGAVNAHSSLSSHNYPREPELPVRLQVRNKERQYDELSVKYITPEGGLDLSKFSDNIYLTNDYSEYEEGTADIIVKGRLKNHSRF